MLARDLLAAKGTEVATTSGSVPLAEALAMFVDRNIGSLVVTADGRTIDGVVSERDAIRAVVERGDAALRDPVAAVMDRDPYTCVPSTTVEELIAIMTRHRVRHVPVVVDGALAGIVSIGDVVKSRIVELETESESIRDYIWHGR